MKILFIIDSLNMGGKERRLVELLKGLKENQLIDFELVILSDQIFYEYIKESRIKIHYLKRNKNLKDFYIVIKLNKICREFKPDILHSWESMCSIYALPIAKIFRTKFLNGMITNSIKIKPFDKRWIRTKLTFPFSDYIISNSNAGLKNYNVKNEKGICIHNGFDFMRIKRIEDPQKIRDKFNISTPFVIGMVARFSPQKDYQTFFRGALKILKNRDDVTFLAIGDGPNLAYFKEKKFLQNNEKIKFLGLQQDVESIINILDIGVILTANIHLEGISNTILEYMALGKPVIATDGGGTPEIISDNKTGFLIDSYDIDAFVQKMTILLNDKDYALMLGEYGQTTIKEKFSLENMIYGYIKLYEQCLNE